MDSSASQSKARSSIGQEPSFSIGYYSREMLHDYYFQSVNLEQQRYNKKKNKTDNQKKKTRKRRTKLTDNRSKKKVCRAVGLEDSTAEVSEHSAKSLSQHDATKQHKSKPEKILETSTSVKDKMNKYDKCQVSSAHYQSIGDKTKMRRIQDGLAANTKQNESSTTLETGAKMPQSKISQSAQSFGKKRTIKERSKPKLRTRNVIYEKKRHEHGTRIFAKWIHDHNGKYWYPGIVESYDILPPVDPKYGDRRIYDIQFDDGQEGKIPEELVFSEDDYFLLADATLFRRLNRLGFKVEYNKSSKDRYANMIGWVDSPHSSEAFESIRKAGEKHDAFIVASKGPLVKEDELVFPNDYVFELGSIPTQRRKTDIADFVSP